MSSWDKIVHYTLCMKCMGHGSVRPKARNKNYYIQSSVCLECRGEGQVIEGITYVNRLNGAVIDAQLGQ